MWLAATIATLPDVTVHRPKRLNWEDELTADQSIIVRQMSWQVIGEDDRQFKVRGLWDITCVVVESDNSSVSIDRRANALAALVEQQILADTTCDDQADYEGLQILGYESILGPQIAGVIIKLAVTYSHLRTDFTVKGSR